jgi:hypothetical protein
MNCNKITASELRAVVSYDPESGIFIRSGPSKPNSKSGSRVDVICTTGLLAGYRRVKIDGVRYMAHRLAWLYVYGEFPAGTIDHINGCHGDNRISNLRDVPHGVNMQNRRTHYKNSQTGVLGVHRDKGRFRASISHQGKTVHLGSYLTIDEAQSVYVAAKRRLHEGCTI